MGDAHRGHPAQASLHRLALNPKYVRDPSFESLQVIMDAGRASSHLRRYLRS
jgi:hypothetical protein